MDVLGSVPALIWVQVIKEDQVFVEAPSRLGRGHFTFIKVMKTVPTFSFPVPSFYSNSDQGRLGLLCFEEGYVICEALRG